MTSRNPLLAPKTCPVVVGHRGVPKRAQENTRAGLLAAVEIGLRAVEVDLMLTRDDVVVLFHDRDTERLTGEPGTIAERTWDEVSRLRIGRRIHMGNDPHGKAQWVEYPDEQPIARLDHVLEEFGDRLAFDLELKPMLPRWSGRRIGQHTARVIQQTGTADAVVVTSFDFFKLQALSRVMPELPAGFIHDDGLLVRLGEWMRWLPPIDIEFDRPPSAQLSERWLDVLLGANSFGQWIDASVIAVHHHLLDPESIARLRERGMNAVGTYTLLPMDARGARRPDPNEAAALAEVDRLASLGVDWIETDDPERLLERLG